ncbi:ATP-binding cassette domain-containing protein [Amycolatopsis sp. NPDC058986]|uniref:ATP-binding cassette domain-containing protein n=1 Tax=unclassified Amycolatopsis TaxID=2618356 RepID=UPI003671FF39
MSFGIRVEGLVKRFGPTVALDGIDLAAGAGTVLGVLGPNGAGKTTAVRILATLVRPDAGVAIVDGHDVVRDPVAVREVIGLTGQYASVDGDLTGTENLVLMGRLLGMSARAARARAGELADRFRLDEVAGRAAKTYSGGTRRRLDLAASLLGRPRVLFLDEPTTGLDAHVRRELWDVVRRLVADGVTVLLTTQYLEEADRLADRIAVFYRGRVVAEGTPGELKRRIGGHTLRVRPAIPGDVAVVAGIVGKLAGAAPAYDTTTGLLTVPARDPLLVSTVVRKLDEAGIAADELALRLPSLDEVFLSLTGVPGERPVPEGSAV